MDARSLPCSLADHDLLAPKGLRGLALLETAGTEEAEAAVHRIASVKRGE